MRDQPEAVPRDIGRVSYSKLVVYQHTVPQQHFLRNLRELLSREALTQEWVALDKGGKLTIGQDPNDRAGPRESHKTERKIEEGKSIHGLGRCQYLGVAHYRVQDHLTTLAPNLERLAKLLHGFGFRQPASRAPKASSELWGSETEMRWFGRIKEAHAC